MIIITLILAGYITLGWLSLEVLEKQKSFFDQFINLILLGSLLVLVFYIGKWLQINQELVFLFGIGIGSMGFRVKFDIYDAMPFLLFLATISYYWFVLGFLQTLYLFLLASVISFVVQIPLTFFPTLYEKETYQGSLSKAYVFSVVSFSNIILYYFLYGI